ncbi:serine hydrolase [Aquicoccus sp. SCR17]|nr:serine hydrolase [Carideicomes alvinocaridis]
MPTRRAALGLIAAPALLPRSALAQPAGDWAAIPERAARFDQFHAISVAHEGEVVLEEAVRGPALSRPVNVKSVSKTLVAALLGAAIDRGAVPGLEATLGEVAPGLVPAGAEAGVADITLGQLVTLRAGLERTSGPNYGAWIASNNWVADALSRPFVAEPGGRMLYSTGSFHVLGAALTEATGRSLLALARDWLGDPLGVEIPAWTRDPQGYYLGGNQMALTLAAMRRFGEMYRMDGLWQGERVLSDAWVRQSFEPVTRSPFSGLQYGLGWFLGRAGGTEYALARGYGGQVIFVAPDAQLTVALTSDPTRPARSGGYFGDLMTLLTDEILPLARG